MKKIIQRLIVFVVGLPVLLSIVIFFPQCNHLLMNLAVIVFTILGAVEFRNILANKGLVISLSEAIVLGAISPAAWTLVVSFGVSSLIVPGAFALGAIWLLVSKVFSSEKYIDLYISRSTAGFALMIYPGLFMAWIVQMAVLPHSSMLILLYLLLVLLNDSAAWLAGILFGKGNRGIVKASPNKSIAGFISGLAISVITGILAPLLLPGVFVSTLMPSLLAGALLGLGTGSAAILGDLSESALKRSAGLKDSGSLILGRGGALDSLDSLALAAPVFYIIYQVLFFK